MKGEMMEESMKFAEASTKRGHRSWRFGRSLSDENVGGQQFKQKKQRMVEKPWTYVELSNKTFCDDENVPYLHWSVW